MKKKMTYSFAENNLLKRTEWNKKRKVMQSKKHYQVIFQGGESLYFDTLSDARNAISEARREADIYHRRNTSAEFEKWKHRGQWMKNDG